jgi:hypothetical protein
MRTEPTQELFGSRSSSARFGTTLAALGDVNRDGFEGTVQKKALVLILNLSPERDGYTSFVIHYHRPHMSARFCTRECNIYGNECVMSVILHYNQ